MTPQLFINYKLKSIAHLPWRMLTYKALNTFIDDLYRCTLLIFTFAESLSSSRSPSSQFFHFLPL